MFLFLLCWVFLAAHGSSLAVACGLGSLAACGILVPRPGIEPTSPAVEVWILNQWTTKEVPGMGWNSHSFLILDVLIRAEYSLLSNFGGKFACLSIRVKNAAQALRQ